MSLSGIFIFDLPKDKHPARFIQSYIWFPGTLACQESRVAETEVEIFDRGDRQSKRQTELIKASARGPNLSEMGLVSNVTNYSVPPPGKGIKDVDRRSRWRPARLVFRFTAFLTLN